MNDLNFNNNENTDNLNAVPEKKNNNKKLIAFIAIATVFIIAGGIGGYFVFKKPIPPAPFEPTPQAEQVGRCGDNICDAFEKANPSSCPSDCKTSSSGPTPAYGLFQLYGDEYQQFRASMGFSLSDYWNFVDRHVAKLNIRFTRTNVLLIWAMVEPVLGDVYDWNNEAKTDSVVRATYAPAPGKKMDMLLVLDPARAKGTPVEFQKSYPYGREAEWQTFVRAAVERYDGDGVADADPYVRVKYWQVMKEPFGQFKKGHPNLYL